MKNYLQIIKELEKKYNTDLYKIKISLLNKIKRFLKLPYKIKMYFIPKNLIEVEILIYDIDNNLERAKILSEKNYINKKLVDF